MDTINTTAETEAPAAARKSNWMITLAEVLFWITAVFQFILVMRDMHDAEFTRFVYYHALPAIGVLAYCGIRKEQKGSAELQTESSNVAENNQA